MINKRGACIFFLLLSFLFISGCWDSSEVNDIAIELAWGIDKAKDDKVAITAQTIIPTKISGDQSGGRGGGGNGRPFFTVTTEGTNTLDAVQRMQAKLSRQLFRGHRRVIVIGEAMARHGLKKVIDTYTRDPDLKLRSDIFIVKENTAKNFLKLSYPLESVPGLGVSGEFKQLGTLIDTGFLNFLLSATSEGACPAVPAISIGMDSDSQDEQSGNDQEGFRIAGSGILNKDLKLVGFLDSKESLVMRWVSGNINKWTVPVTIPHEDGNISVDLYKMRSKINPVVKGDKLNIQVSLTAQGAIRENNTSLDLSKPERINLLQETLKKQIEETVLQMITKVQKNYATDVFGFSNTIRRKNLSFWKSIRNDWEKEFQEAGISVNAKCKIRRIGVTGPSLHLNEKEIEK